MPAEQQWPVRLYLYAWPSDIAQKALKPGQLVPTTLLAKATTSGTGRYTLTVPVTKLKAAAVESGYANLELQRRRGLLFQLFNTGFVKQRERKPAWAVVGQGYIAPQRNTRGDTVAFSYVQSMSATQTSTLGIGISGYGISAGYNTTGSDVSTATAGVDYPKEAATPRTMLNDFPGASRKPCTGWRCFHADGTPTPAGVPGYFGGQCPTPTRTAPGTA